MLNTNQENLFKSNTTRLLPCALAWIFLFSSCSSVEIPESKDGDIQSEDETDENKQKIPEKMEILATANKPLETPERDLAQAQFSIDVMVRKLKAAKSIPGNRGYGPFDLNALAAYEEALAKFSQENWKEVIKNLNLYLNKSQVTDSPKYLESQWMLAISHDKSGQKSRALRAYLRYINYFFQTNQKDHLRLSLAIKNCLEIAKNTPNLSLNLKSLVSGLSLFRLPDEPFIDITIQLAKAALEDGNHHVSQTLVRSLESRFGQKPPRKVILGVTYIRALNLVAQKKWTQANNHLEYLSKQSDDESIKDHAHLLLGRYYFAAKKWATALTHYNKIPDKSLYFKDACYESFISQIRSENDTNARSLAVLYLSRWPEDPKTNSIRLNMSYLDLRSSEYALAETGIQDMNSKLTTLRNAIKNSLNNPSNLNQAQLLDLRSMTKGTLEKQSILEESANYISEINQLRNSILERFGELRDLHQSLSQSNLNRIFPDLSNRTLQLAYFGANILNIAESMILSQVALTEATANPIDLQKLKFQSDKYHMLSSTTLKLHQTIKSNIKSSEYMAMISAINELKKRLFILESELKGTYVHGYQKKTASTKDKSRELLTKIAFLRSKISADSATIRSLQIKEILNHSEVYTLESSISRQMLVIDSQVDIIYKMLASVTDPSQKPVVDKSLDLWEQWKSLSKLYFSQIHDLKSIHQTKIMELLSNLDRYESEIIKADYEALNLRNRTIFNIRDNATKIAENMSEIIDERLAKHQRWLNEIEWMKFESQRKKADKSRQQRLLEQQILEDQYNSDLFTVNNFN